MVIQYKNTWEKWSRMWVVEALRPTQMTGSFREKRLITDTYGGGCEHTGPRWNGYHDRFLPEVLESLFGDEAGFRPPTGDRIRCMSGTVKQKVSQIHSVRKNYISKHMKDPRDTTKRPAKKYFFSPKRQGQLLTPKLKVAKKRAFGYLSLGDGIHLNCLLFADYAFLWQKVKRGFF